MNNPIEGLFEISRRIGGQSDFFQGSGGNTSVKLDNHLMVVKASGFKVSDMKEDFGWVTVDYRKIADWYGKVSGKITLDEENKTSAFVRSCAISSGDSSLRPSIETAFHAFLNTFVVHSHSVYANIINCAENGKEIFEKFSNMHSWNAEWIPYVNPGHALALRIKDSSRARIIFLQNHGLVVSGDNHDEVMKIHERVNGAIKNYFKTPHYPSSPSDYLSELAKTNSDIITELSKPLFPDQYVFSSDVQVHISDSKASSEVLAAAAFILKCLHENGITPNFISEDDQNYLAGMDSEKHRQKLIS